jgi:UDP-N-acetylglucosamine--N-acetylmuramyl-(pentapeptide) pyrophosphoryl-undecaprenol N-acetylglucosamine transferase
MLVPEALKAIKGELPEVFKVIHQTGKDDEQRVKDLYASLGVNAEVAAFFDDMARLYRQADVIISRAGATTLAEMTVMGKPMVLIPYPYAADDHQRKNGEYLVAGGAARMFLQDELTPTKLSEEIILLFAGKERREEMAAAARKLAMPNAVEVIVKEIITMARKG